MDSLKTNTTCAWCQSEVVKGAIVCRHCNAEHSYVYANPIIRFLFPFLAGLGIVFTPLSIWFLYDGSRTTLTFQILALGVISLTLTILCARYAKLKSSWRRVTLNSK